MGRLFSVNVESAKMMSRSFEAVGVIVGVSMSGTVSMKGSLSLRSHEPRSCAFYVPTWAHISTSETLAKAAFCG